MNIIKYRTILFTLFCLLTIACNEEDDVISKEGKAFVGEWKCKITSKPDWVFRADGTCTMKPSLNSDQDGFWEYDSKTKRLATTCSNWTWDVQVVTENEWSGISVSGGSVYSYSRVGSTIDNTKKLHGTWTRTNGTNTYMLTIKESSYSFVHKSNNTTKATYSGTCKIQDNGNDSYAMVLGYSGKQATFTTSLNANGNLRLIYLNIGSTATDLKVIEGTYK